VGRATAAQVPAGAGLADLTVADVVPGDVEGLQAWALHLAELGSMSFGDVVQRLDAVSATATREWQGPAAEAAETRLRLLGRTWRGHARNLGDLAQHVSWYAQVIHQAQQMAARALTLADHGLREHDRWVLAVRLVAAGYPAPGPGPDPGPPWWNAAATLARQARDRARTAGATLADVLRTSAATAPHHPAIGEDPWAALGRLWNGVSIGWNDLTALAAVADPSRLHTDPGPYRQDLKALADTTLTGLADLLAHPWQHTEDTWDSLAADPATAAGSGAFALATTLTGTVGGHLGWTATAAATRTALTTATSRLPDLARRLFADGDGLDLALYTTRSRLGLTGLPLTGLHQWALPPGPRAPWYDPDSHRIDPSRPAILRTTPGTTRQLWGDTLRTGPWPSSAFYLNTIGRIPAATMELLAAHARTGDWTELADLARSSGYDVPDAMVDLANGEYRQGRQGLYLGKSVFPQAMAQDGEFEIGGLHDVPQRLLTSIRLDSTLHEAGHAAHALFLRSPDGLATPGSLGPQPGHQWPRPLRTPDDPFPQLTDALYWRIMNGEGGPGLPAWTRSQDVRHLTGFDDARRTWFTEFEEELFADGLRWYWGQDHSRGPAPFLGIRRAGDLIWPYFHDYVPQRLAASQFPVGGPALRPTRR
jgi:hypothetical protein